MARRRKLWVNDTFARRVPATTSEGQVYGTASGEDLTAVPGKCQQRFSSEWPPILHWMLADLWSNLASAAPP